jgi:protein-disulfide isomerase
MAGTNQLKIFYVALGAVVVVGVGALLVARARGGAQAATVAPAPVDTESFPGHVLGSDSAPVTIIEYADFECPACGQYAVLTEPDVRKRLVDSGLVRVIFHDFPLNIHRNTMAAHLAAQCAGDQGKFWEMHDQLYFNQSRWAYERRPAGTIRGLAAAIGLDLGQYDACVNSGKYLARLEQMAQESAARGVSETPTFDINGKRVSGIILFDEMRTLVDQAAAARK